MKKILLLTAFAALAGSANALIVPGDTFDFYLRFGNDSLLKNAVTTATSGEAVLTSTFGTTQTLTGALLNGADLTISSSETLSGTNTIDTITISTPVNFLGVNDTDGSNGLTFGFGDAANNAINGSGNGIDYVTVGGVFTGPNFLTAKAGGSFTYGGNTVLPLTGGFAPNITFTTPRRAISVNSGIGVDTSYTPHVFTYTITYPTVAAPVPEPSALAALGLGGLALLRRRKRN